MTSRRNKGQGVKGIQRNVGSGEVEQGGCARRRDVGRRSRHEATSRRQKEVPIALRRRGMGRH